MIRNRKNNSGTTLIETMLAVLIFSIISLVISLFLASSLRGYKKAQAKAATENAVMLFNENLNVETARIRLPYWAKPDLYETETAAVGISLSIPWYNGDSEQLLTISGGANGTEIITADHTLTYKTLALTELEHVLTDEQNYIKVVISTNGENRELDFMFSGFGVPDGK